MILCLARISKYTSSTLCESSVTLEQLMGCRGEDVHTNELKHDHVTDLEKKYG